MNEKFSAVQASLAREKIDGWLFYDFRRSNELACGFLEIPQQTLLTRRFFYWLPKQGEPVKIVSAIEDKVLHHLSGTVKTYRTWKELEKCLEDILSGCRKVAMEYSPRNAIPSVSKVDGGTLELVRSFGVDVVSSANLLQQYTSVWDARKLDTHLKAADILCEAVDQAWQWIASNLTSRKRITEYAVQQYLLETFAAHRCVTSDPPICAVNEHSADPHYLPTKEHSSAIGRGDFILIDLWCKQDLPRAAYADITRVGVAAPQPTSRQNEIFTLVKRARDRGVELIRECMREKRPLMGCEVDQACRQVIEKGGYGGSFIHRTGHNIDETDHGNGAHIDNYETHDCRELLPGTCFSIEPGVYLPGEFGVRLEYDVFIHSDRRVQITGGIQNSITCLF
ncbi:MAG: M24 family metallopeptidase [Waddliaceae bacterium]